MMFLAVVARHAILATVDGDAHMGHGFSFRDVRALSIWIESHGALTIFDFAHDFVRKVRNPGVKPEGRLVGIMRVRAQFRLAAMTARMALIASSIRRTASWLLISSSRARARASSSSDASRDRSMLKTWTCS